MCVSVFVCVCLYVVVAVVCVYSCVSVCVSICLYGYVSECERVLAFSNRLVFQIISCTFFYPT